MTLDVGSNNAAEVPGTASNKGKTPDVGAAGETLEEERQTFTREGEKVSGFASAIFPTMEEKTVIDHRLPQNRVYVVAIDEDPELEAQEDAGKAPQQSTVEDSEAVSSAAGNDHLLRDKLGQNDPDSPEQLAHARSILRKNIGAKPGKSPWTLLTPTPKIDPNGFEDPICDAFWKNVWVAAAVHNVRLLPKLYDCSHSLFLAHSPDGDLP